MARRALPAERAWRRKEVLYLVGTLGLTTQETADKLGWSRQTITADRAALRLPTNRRIPSEYTRECALAKRRARRDSRRARVVELINTHTPTWIARHFGVNEGTITRDLYAMGMAYSRSRGEWFYRAS